MSIEKITVKIGDRELELTMDEARALWSDLDEIFNAKSDGSLRDRLAPFLPNTPYVPPYERSIPMPHYPSPYKPLTTWCSSDPVVTGV